MHEPDYSDCVIPDDVRPLLERITTASWQQLMLGEEILNLVKELRQVESYVDPDEDSIQIKERHRCSWEVIGRALGIAKQSAQGRYGPLCD